MIKLIQGKYEIAKQYYKEDMNQDFFEFHFVYTSANEVFRELNRFVWESRHYKTRFKNRYEGPALIDITEWNQGKLNDYFDAFLYFIKDSPHLECTFIVQEICSQELLKKLESFFEINIEKLEVRNDKSKRQIGFCLKEEEKENVRI